MPYGHESSEESDQENCGALDNGCLAKSHLNGNNRTGEAYEKSPQATNGESGVHHNGNRLNGPTYGISKSSQNGHHYGHHKVNGHNTSEKISGSNHGSSSSVATVVANGLDCDHSQTSKETQISDSSQASSSQSIHPAASESQLLSTPDTRAKAVSEPLPQHAASSAVSSPPSAAATKTHSVTSRESASSSAHHSDIDAALSTPPDCSQSTNGASAPPLKISRGGDEAIDRPQGGGPSAGTEGRTDAKEPHQSKPSSRGNDGQSSRDRERDRRYSDWSRDRDRHYRDRSQERDSDGDRYRHRRDYRDDRYHRSYRDRLPPHDRSYRDWESERHRERTYHHPRERDRDRCSNHYHHHSYRSRDDWGRDWRGHGHSYRDESHSRRRWQEEGRESRSVKDKSNGRDRDYYTSKEEISSPAAAPEATTKSKGSPPRARLSSFESAPNREDQNHKRTADPPSKERDDSSEARRSKKHKKSKKKKKSKDKDRHRESGSSDVDSDRAIETKKKKKKKRQRDNEAEQHSPGAARSHKNRSSEERESRKRRYNDIKDAKYDNGYSPEKRRRTDSTDGRNDHLLPSNHTSPANGSTHRHLNGHTGNGYSQTNGDSHGFSGGFKH